MILLGLILLVIGFIAHISILWTIGIVLLVVGGGFAGFYATRTLERLLPPGAADLTLVSATDHLCYSPLLPEVAAGRLEPRRIAVPLHARLRRTRVRRSPACSGTAMRRGSRRPDATSGSSGL